MDSSRTLLLLFLLLHLSDTKEQKHFEAVREGDNITLFCKNEIPDQSPCENTEWNFTKISKNSTNTTLFSRKQKNKEVTFTVSLSKNCSLVLKNVTLKQVGLYTCRQFTGNDQQKTDTIFRLFVVKLSQEKKDDRVTFNCSVVRHGTCKHTVKWFNTDTEVNKNHSELELQTSHSLCWASVSFLDRSPPSQFYQSLKCEVKHNSSETKVTLIPQPPDDKRTTEDPQTEASLDDKRTTEDPQTEASLDDKRPTEEPQTEASLDDKRPTEEPQTGAVPGWLLLVVVPVVSAAALFTAAVVLIVWRRHRGTRAPTDRDTVEPEDGVTYASVQFKNNNRVQTQDEDDEDEDAVTYSSVKLHKSNK